MDSVFHSSIPTEASFSLERPNEISAAFGAFFKQALARVETRFEEAAALDIPNSNLAIIRSVGVETEPEHGNDHLTSEENCAKEYHFRSQIKARGRTNVYLYLLIVTEPAYTLDAGSAYSATSSQSKPFSPA